MAQSVMHRINGCLDAGTESCSLVVHDNNSIEEQTAQIESLLFYGEFKQSLLMFVYEISAPPKEFPSINGN